MALGAKRYARSRFDTLMGKSTQGSPNPKLKARFAIRLYGALWIVAAYGSYLPTKPRKWAKVVSSRACKPD